MLAAIHVPPDQSSAIKATVNSDFMRPAIELVVLVRMCMCMSHMAGPYLKTRHIAKLRVKLSASGFFFFAKHFKPPVYSVNTSKAILQVRWPIGGELEPGLNDHTWGRVVPVVRDPPVVPASRQLRALERPASRDGFCCPPAAACLCPGHSFVC